MRTLYTTTIVPCSESADAMDRMATRLSVLGSRSSGYAFVLLDGPAGRTVLRMVFASWNDAIEWAVAFKGAGRLDQEHMVAAAVAEMGEIATTNLQRIAANQALAGDLPVETEETAGHLDGLASRDGPAR